MLDQVLDIFNIVPAYDLNLMRADQDLFTVTSDVLISLRKIIGESKPDIVLVQGDTTTTFAASLASYYLKVPVGHIEAGLRTNNKYEPFPEEINRRITTQIADLNFAPTNMSKTNLLKEGVPEGKIFVTGNTVVDALYNVLDIMKNTDINEKLQKKFRFLLANRKFVLITGHRRESFGEGFKNICTAIRRLAEDMPEYDFVYPVHLNPNVQKPVGEILNQGKLSNIYLCEPLDYLLFIGLMKKSYLVLTDSGGVQEEAITFNKPILVMRDTTERPEGIEVGAAKLIGNKQENIFNECKCLLTDNSKYNKMAKAVNPYGDGKAAERIVKVLREKL
jgi:UDP-N-acetylglucosamine 2-epimerase (non-hydrolysing)